MKNFDVFISYRRLSRSDLEHRHSTSLARSVAQQFDLEGYSVYFDCWDDTQNYKQALKNSKYFVVLLTSYSFNDKEKEAEEKEDNFKEEIKFIKELVINDESKKENIFLINVDSRLTTDTIKSYFVNDENKYLGPAIIELQTNSEFSIKKLIAVSKHDGKSKKKIKTALPRVSYKFCKKATLLSAILLPIAIVMAYLLYQYHGENIIFAGGGTVQKYLLEEKGIDVKKYERGSKYIHLPSTTAYQLLWDDVNEDATRQYCPVVLSAGKIDTTGIDLVEFQQTKRIAEYQIDSIPLMIQIFDNNNSKDTITIDSLKKLLCNSNYEIWSTTKESGTYLEYKKLLNNDGEFNFDSVLNNQDGGWKCFNLKGPIGSLDSKKKQIYLANKYYYNTVGKNMSEYSIISDTITKVIKTEKLYVYTIALLKVKNGGYSSELELLPAAKKFLYRIGCNTADRTTNDFDPADSKGIIIPWN